MAFITSFAFDDEDIFFTSERHNKMLHCGLNVRKIWLCIYGPWTRPVRGRFEAAWCPRATRWIGLVQTTAHGHQHTTVHHAYLQLAFILSWLLEGTSSMDFGRETRKCRARHSAVKHIILHQMESLTLKSKYKGTKNGAVQELGGMKASHWCNGVEINS